MAFKKYELKVSFIVDDTFNEIMNDIEDMKLGIKSGQLKNELMRHEGYSNIEIQFEEIVDFQPWINTEARADRFNEELSNYGK